MFAFERESPNKLHQARIQYSHNTALPQYFLWGDRHHRSQGGHNIESYTATGEAQWDFNQYALQKTALAYTEAVRTYGHCCWFLEETTKEAQVPVQY